MRSQKISASNTGKKRPLAARGAWTNEARKTAADQRHHAAEARWKNAPWENVPKSRRRERLLLEQNGKCAICKILPIWNNTHLTFQLDHVSGDRLDETRSNLRLLCPNCHSQTATWCSKNVSESGRERMLAGWKKKTIGE